MTKATLLIIEDEVIIADRLALQLSKEGYHIMAKCATGAQALKALQTEQPDLAIVDISLRGDMDGIEVVSQFPADIPVIYLTALSDQETLSRAASRPMENYLLKPYNRQQLLVAVELALRQNPIAVGDEKEEVTKKTVYATDDFIWYRSESSYHRMPINKLRNVKADNSYIELIFDELTVTLSMNLAEFERCVDHPMLVRINRSHVINLAHVTSFAKSSRSLLLETTDGKKELSISALYRENFTKRINEQ